jgi:hypothetical protein
MIEFITNHGPPLITDWTEFDSYLDAKRAEQQKQSETLKAKCLSYNSQCQTIRTRLEPKPVTIRELTLTPVQSVLFAPRRGKYG